MALNDNELQSFLDEIDDIDDDESIAPEKEYKQQMEIRSAERRALKAKNKAQRTFIIKNGYINASRTALLYEPIDQSLLVEIVEIKSKRYVDLADRVKQTLTKKIEAILFQYIPGPLKKIFAKHKNCFIRHPGFIYCTSVESGAKKLIITPDVPMFFEQHTEMRVIERHSRLIKHQFDELVIRYHNYTEKAIKLETKTALFLSRIKNLIDLIELDVDYYDLYINLKNAKDEINQTKI